MKICKLILLVVFVASLLCVDLMATTVSFRNGVDGYAGTLDTMIQKGAKAEYNYGGQDAFLVQGEWEYANPAAYAESLIKFDISSVPVGQTIDSAVLRIRYNSSANPNGYARRFRLHPMLVSVNYGNKDDAPASVGEVTMNQRAQSQTNWGQPNPLGFGPQPDVDFDSSIFVKSLIDNSQIGTFIEIDITSILAMWYNGTLTNNGLLLLGDTSQIGDWFNSSEASDISKRPELVVSYTIPEPATLSLLAVGALSLLRRRR